MINFIESALWVLVPLALWFMISLALALLIAPMFPR
jgi:hypothetical protein